MDDILFRYQRLDPTSWAYLASLLALALYFKFSRFWSVRNFDLLGLILLSPALLLVQFGLDQAAAHDSAKVVEHVGYIWLFAVHGVFLLRLLLDAAMVRRPLLEPNMTAGGLSFVSVCLLLFLSANIALGGPEAADWSRFERPSPRGNAGANGAAHDPLAKYGPGLPVIFRLPHISTREHVQSAKDEIDPRDSRRTIEPNDAAVSNSALAESTGSDIAVAPRSEPASAKAAVEFDWEYTLAARIIAIGCQLAIVVGVVLVGLRHYDNAKTGIAVATLYLLLPYTAMWSGSVIHGIPGGLLTWAVVFYRRPLLAGALIGLACGAAYYPIFVLPLWCSFYWRRGLRRFLVGAAVTILILVGTLALTVADTAEFFAGLRQMFGLRFPAGADDQLSGAWEFWQPVFRFPILAAFLGLSISLILWPVQKNLGSLIALTAAVMLGTQFWHAHSGGLALAWYLPLLLLTIFRPNLEDRTALAVVR